MSKHSDILYRKNGNTYSAPVTVIDVRKGEAYYHNRQLRLEDGSIVDSQPVDGPSDFFVTAGFINCHMHWLMTGSACSFEEMIENISARPGQALEQAISHARDALKMGITFGCDKGPPGTCAAPVYQGIAAVASGGEPMTNSIYSTYAFMAPEGFGAPYGRMIYNEKEMEIALIEQEASGAGVYKFIPESPFVVDENYYHFLFSLEAFYAARQKARQNNRVFAVHAKGTETIDQCIKVEADCIEHGVQISDEQLLAFQEKDIYLGPTMHGLWCRLEQAKKTGIHKESATHDWETVCGMVSRAAVLNDGKPFTHMLFSSDAGSYVTPHASLRELYFMRKMGYPPAWILEAATVNGAKCLKQEHRGMVKKGMRADLIFWTKNPLELTVDQWEHLDQYIAAVVLSGKEAHRKDE